MIHVLTVGHVRFDTRIWIKEISSLVRAGYQVRYHVADGDGNEMTNGVEIIDYGVIPSGAGARFRLKKMYQVMTESGLKRGDWVHFHDGIFLPFALLLALKGCKVIYDVHEDYPKQVMSSRFPWLGKKLWSYSIAFMELLGRCLFKSICAATPAIAERFPAKKTSLVQNFPLLEELQAPPEANRLSEEPNPQNKAIFLGGLNLIRGAIEMAEAVALANEKIPVKLLIAGNFSPASLEAVVKQNAMGQIETAGFVDRITAAQLLAESKMGLVVFHPEPNHIKAQPNKLFEYMSAGIPVIASDFPLWRQIVENAGCGLLVDPMAPKAIADAMVWLLENPESAAEMGRAGRRAVEQQYNWEVEEQKLLQLYRGNQIAAAAQ